MAALKAAIKNGRLILNEATDLAEGAEVELAMVHGHDGDTELSRRARGGRSRRSRRRLGRFWRRDRASARSREDQNHEARGTSDRGRRPV